MKKIDIDKYNQILIKYLKVKILIITLFFTLNIQAQTQVDEEWDANWITVPGISETEYGVYLFRKEIVLNNIPDSFTVCVSADNQYKLFLNEQLVSFGPSKSDIKHWNYEIVDLKPFLQEGKNILTAKVWNDGSYRQEAQISLKTGFILQGTSEKAEIANTNESWKCIQDDSYKPVNIGSYGMGEVNVRGYYVAGPGERIDMHKKIKNWKKLSFDDSKWQQAETVFKRNGFSFGAPSEKSWTLIPSILPPMELTYQRLVKLRKATGISIPPSFPSEKIAFEVPAYSTATILLDQTFLTNAFPTLVLSGGNNSVVTITYAESLYEGSEKGNRNEIEGKEMLGKVDVVVSDGSLQQNFTSLTYRTYRYVEIKIETKETSLTIEDFYGTFTGYPFQLNASLKTDRDELQKILNIGWRSARLCAHDIYMDTPFYEKLQYIGDTRIQALVSLFNSGDDRLMKNALNLMDYSRQRDGFTLSRYPTASENQVIAPFSLFYIGMLHDLMMYGSDEDFIRDKLAGARQVMNFFIGLQDLDGSLKNVPGWNFTDWATGPVEGWNRGAPPIGLDGSSSILDLQLLMGLQAAVKLEQTIGRDEFAALYEKLVTQLSETIHNKYWDDSRNLFADTPEKDKFSQHANTLAILTGLVYGKEATELGQLILSDSTLTQASIYFKYYLHQALVKAGLGNEYLSWLDIWRKNIELGLTTWGEDSDVEGTRSDCHAWGASPNIEFFRTILGIDSDAPGFKKIKIEPHLGDIQKIAGEIPHSLGRITVSYNITYKKLDALINLPQGTTGIFIWKGKTYDLTSGENIISF